MQTITAIATRMRCRILLVAVIAATGCAEGFDERTDPTVATPGVAATVNGAIIPADELAAYMTNGQTRERALAELIDEELVVQAAHAAHITVSPAEVDAAYAEIKRQNHLDDAGLASALAASGYTVARYRVALEHMLVKIRAINVIVAPTVAAVGDKAARHAALDAKTSVWIAQLRQHAVIDIAVESKLSAR